MSKSVRGFKLKSSNSGFTLIELLIVIVIIAILATVGIVSYSGMQNKAKDAKRKADLNAISKAYEANARNGVYQKLQGSQFTSGQIPKTPEGGSYPCVFGPEDLPQCSTKTTDKFLVCVALGNKSSASCYPPSDTCFCQSSAQSTTSSGSSGGGSGDSGGGSSCDPFNQLRDRLIGYWNFDQLSDTTISDVSGNGYNATFNGTAPSLSTDVPSSNFNKSANLNGSNNYISNASLPFPQTSGTISLWIKGDFTTQGASFRTIIDDWNNTRSHFFIRTYNSGNNMQVIAQQPAGYVFSTTATLNNNAWNFLALTYDTAADKVNLYVNGVNTIPPGTISDSAWVPSGQNITFGGSPLGNYFTGLIDDVRIYNTAISPSLINLLAAGCGP